MAKDANELKSKANEAAGDALEAVNRHVPPEVRPHVAILVPALIGAFILGLMTWAASEIYEAVTEHDGLAQLDQPVLDFMVSIRQPWINTIVGGFTQIGGPVVSPILAVVTVVVLARIWRTWLPVTLMVAGGLGSLTVTIVGKDYIDRVRPPHQFAIAPFETSPSFPSGHALNAVVVGGIVAYLLWRRLERRRRARVVVVVLAVVYALAMGMSRVYLGHHWLTDVITGWVLGLAWLAAVIATHLVVVALITRRSDRAALDAPQEPGQADEHADPAHLEQSADPEQHTSHELPDRGTNG